MPTASRSVRKMRRIKRDRSQAYRLLDIAIKQRDEMRATANLLLEQLRTKTKKENESTTEGALTGEVITQPSDPSVVYGDVAAALGSNEVTGVVGE